MKIVFIVNDLSAQRCIKRIREFIEHGYDVEVYGYYRTGKVFPHLDDIKINILGEFDNTISYAKRLKIMYKSVKNIVNKYKGGVVYYLFQLDVALAFKACLRSYKYIYEESDMSHTYIGNRCVREILEFINKRIILKSVLTVFTSEGFLKYHFGNRNLNNVEIVTNRLSTKILKIAPCAKKEHNGLSIGFVGALRFNSTLNFIDVFCRNFPDYEFHIFGSLSNSYINKIDELRMYKNCIFHGSFKNPDELPEIYSQIDMVLSTYDVAYENVRYAEPNKLYEAIYFETPIIVSKNTFLSEKVEKLGIGYSINALEENEIIDFIKEFKKSYNDKKENCKKISKNTCLNINKLLFVRLSDMLKNNH